MGPTHSSWATNSCGYSIFPIFPNPDGLLKCCIIPVFPSSSPGHTEICRSWVTDIENASCETKEREQELLHSVCFPYFFFRWLLSHSDCNMGRVKHLITLTFHKLLYKEYLHMHKHTWIYTKMWMGMQLNTWVQIQVFIHIEKGDGKWLSCATESDTSVTESHWQRYKLIWVGPAQCSGPC